jgi:crotonobetainyl-CoA:carnitine CoA-transferase CaiB-like acyl-CoA transferase
MLSSANRPLTGIVVLDFGQVYQGPYATLLMAKAGADVIKIEPPQGEPLRRRAPPGKSTTFPIAMLNSNKRAITLNLSMSAAARCCSAWSSAPMCCWRISRPGSWTGSVSAGRFCTG